METGTEVKTEDQQLVNQEAQAPAAQQVQEEADNEQLDLPPKPATAHLNGNTTPQSPTEGDRDQNGADVANGDAADVADEGEEDGDAPARTNPTGPVTLGYKTFNCVEEAVDYYQYVLRDHPKNVAFNQYEHQSLLHLIKRGHPDPEKKIGDGVVEFQIRPVVVGGQKSNCFFLKRKDGTVDDFSYRKAVANIWPNNNMTKLKPRANKGGGRGRFKGRGGRGGGRGRRGGRFKGRGGGGRGRR